MEIGRDARGIKSLSRHFLEQVVALSSEGILVVDAQDSSLPVVYANSAYEDPDGLLDRRARGTRLVDVAARRG